MRLTNIAASPAIRNFIIHYAAEVYVETARFWQSRYTYHPDTDTADLLFCKGRMNTAG